MTRKEIIQGLQFTIDMFLSDPLTGEVLKKPRNDMDKTTIDACKGAIELLEQQSCYNPDEWCHDCSEYNHDKHCCPRYNKVIRNAVEEIKQPCKDAISREQAIDTVANLFEMSEYPHPYPQGKPIRLKDVKEKLKQLPSVQPKSKVGHWITKPHVYGVTYCSECDFELKIDNTNYCPNCGARMIEPQESEDKK